MVTRQRAPATPVVADAMLTAPARHLADTTVAQARAVFAERHVHLLLLVSGSRLLATLDRDDLAEPRASRDPRDPVNPAAVRDDQPVLPLGSLAGRTVGPDADLAEVRAEMAASGQRRRAVVAPDGTLLGLLCLKSSGNGFCDDAGVAARARSRRDP